MDKNKIYIQNHCYQTILNSQSINFIFHLITIKQKHSIRIFYQRNKSVIQMSLTAKEQVLLKKLISKISKLSQFMRTEGISTKDVNDFVLRCVFDISENKQQITPKLSKDFSSETEQETNSEASDCNRLELEMTLEKVLLQKVTSGTKMDKILLGYLEKCCVEQQKLKNYLNSQEIENLTKKSVLDFEKFREKIGHTKYRKHRYEPTSLFKDPQIFSSFSHLSSIRERIQEVKKRSVVEESERELDYIRSFEKSLTESIQKTKLLRLMLEKQLAPEFSPLSLLTGDDDEVNRGEIY